MTYQEHIDDASADILSLNPGTAITASVALRFVSEAVHKLQKKSERVRRTLQINTTDLDANGQVDTNTDITVIERASFLPTGSAQPVKVTLVNQDFIDSWTQNPTQINFPGPQPYLNQPSSNVQLVLTDYNRKLTFFPATGLNGVFTIVYLPKLLAYSDSRGQALTGDWSGWKADLANKMKITNIPPEFEEEEEAITAYTAAKLLTTIRGWKQLFSEDYNERMATFERAHEGIMRDMSPYNISTQAPFYGGPVGY